MAPTDATTVEPGDATGPRPATGLGSGRRWSSGGPRAVFARGPDERVNPVSSVPFVLVHLAPLAAVFTGVTTTAVVLLVGCYVGRMFFITAGYHRYFAHRSYRLGRVAQFVMAFGGTTAAQKGPLWWAGHHRDHHRTSDTEADIHSPLRGFWWSHLGWILCDRYNGTPLERIKDFAAFPELRFIDRHNWIAPWTLGVACFAIGGWSGLVVGFFGSTVLCWHATFFVNSLAHVFGRRRYATEDTSRNSALIAVLTMGEGWHNNHHYYQASARQGFFWWEWDPTYYVLKALSWVGVVRSLKTPSGAVRRSNLVRDGVFDVGMFRAHWARATRAVLDTRTTIDAAIAERSRVLEQFVQSSLETADELARVSRRHQRELGAVEP